MKYRRKIRQVLLVIESSRAYGRGIIEGVSRYVQEQGCWAIQYEEHGLLSSVPSWLKNWRGDGVICRTGISPLGTHLRRMNLPLVELLGDGKRFVSEVQSDAVVAGRLAAEHFIERGLRNFAYYSYGNSWWGQFRGDAFVDAVKKLGYDAHVFYSKFGTKPEAFPEWRTIYSSKLQRWVAELPKPIGIWCAADTIAQRVHAATLKSGFSIPDDVALLGIDNDEHLCNVLTPTLSSVEPNSIVVGYNAAKLLDEKMNRPKNRAKKTAQKIEPIKIEPLGVVMRQSTDVIAADDPQLVAIARYIRANALNGLLVADVARQFDISRRTIERRFKKHFGRTVDQEITNLRIEHAKQLLRDTLSPVADIGEQAGFDRNYFIKAFHRIVGVSPKKYRVMNQVGRPWDH